MKQFKLSTSLFLLGILLLFPTISAVAQGIIPKPHTVVYRDGQFKIDNETRLYSNLSRKNLKTIRYWLGEVTSAPLKKTRTRNGNQIIRLIQTGKPNEMNTVPFNRYLQGYTLDVSERGIEILSPSKAGLQYGLQTLRNLTAADGTVRYVHIEDTPRFAYRGMMLDCSRHIWTTDFIKKQIDMLVRLKMNRLHLHLTDEAGWRIETKHYPELTEKATYRTTSNWEQWRATGMNYCTKDTPGAYGGYYTKQELRDIVRYAAERGVTVIPELEIPGHNNEVTSTYPQLSCTGERASDLCIGNEKSFEFIEGVLKEIMDIFPSEYIHLGGDEASGKNWLTCERCQKRMNDEHLQSKEQLQAYMMKRVNAFLNRHGRKMIGWDEITTGGTPDGAAVMAWRGADMGFKAAKDSKVIMSPTECYYLDYFQCNPATDERGQLGYTPLKSAYKFDPIPIDYQNKPEAKNIWGVQGNLWTERVDTEEHAEYMIYPRLFAVAEAGWSSPAQDYNDFKTRALGLIARMKRDGYAPYDLQNELGDRNESTSVVVHDAIGKPVTYLSPCSPRYAGTGNGTLVDGKMGDWSFKDNGWQGFIQAGRLSIVIDLQKEMDINNVSADFLQFRGPEIFFPAEVTVAVSTDGQNFEEIDKQTFKDDSTRYFVRPYTWQGKAKGRYVKVTTRAPKQGGFIFCDEVMVNRRG